MKCAIPSVFDRDRRTAVIALAVLVGCAVDPTVPQPGMGGCATQDGTSHSGALNGNVTWTRAASPHIVMDSVSGGNLVIQAGAVVCGAPGSTLSPNQLAVNGNAAQPVLFTGLGGSAWNGIRLLQTAGSSSIRHAVIESAGFGVQAEHNLVLEDSRIVDSGTGVSVRFGVVRRTLVERACTLTPPTVQSGDNFGCAGITLPTGYVSVGPTTAATIEETRVRDSRSIGVNVSMGATATLRDVSIEGSAGTGLTVFRSGGSSSTRLPDLTIVQPLRITGGAGHPASLSWQHVGQLLPDSAAHSRLVGNARDTLLVAHTGTPISGGGSGTTGLMTIRKELPWHVTVIGINGCGALGRVHMEPGAHLTVGGPHFPCTVRGTLTAAGTPDEPVTIVAEGAGSALTVSPVADAPGLSHVRLKRIFLNVSGSTVIEHATLDSSAISHTGPGRIADTHIRWTFPPVMIFRIVPATVSLGAGTRLERTTIELSTRDAVLISGSGAVLEDCTIRNNTLNGIVADSTSSNARVTRCNIERNGGFGVLNRSASPLDARNNWWGDAAGPLGPAGDGAQGNVLYMPFLNAPLQSMRRQSNH